MAIIKLKILSQEGQTLAASPAGENVCLVYSGCYQAGDWVALESDSKNLFCSIQLEDTMPPAIVYLPEGSLQFRIPPADNRSNYSPKSFTGSVHLLRAEIKEPPAVRRNLAFNPYDSHESKGFSPMPRPMWRPETRRFLPLGTPSTAYLLTSPTVSGPIRVGASIGTQKRNSGWILAEL